MSTIRIKDLPSGVLSFTPTAKIPYEDPNDATDTTKFLTISSLGGPFLPLAGGTMTGDINLGNNSLTFFNGSINSSSNVFEILTESDIEFRSTSTDAMAVQFDTARNNPGTFTFLDFSARNAGNNFQIYGGMSANINSSSSPIDGSWRFVVTKAGVIDTDVLGMNVDDDLAVKVFNNIRFNNLSTGADPILQSNSSSQELTLTGDFVLPDGGTLLFGDGGGFISATIGSQMDINVGSNKLEITFPTPVGVREVIYNINNPNIVAPDNTALVKWTADTDGGSDQTYAGYAIDILDNDIGSFEGATRFFTAINAVEDVNILGLNINQQKEVFIYDNIRFNNLSTGADPILQSNSASQQLTLTGDLIMSASDIFLDGGKSLFLGTTGAFIQDLNGTRLDINAGSISTRIMYSGSSPALFELKTNRTTVGEIAMFEFDANDFSYTALQANIVVNTPGSEEGSLILSTMSGGLENIEILGLNINQQKEVLIFNNIRFNNLSTGADPVLQANSSTQQLTLTGELVFDNQGTGADPVIFANSTQNQMSIDGSLAIFLDPTGAASGFSIFGQHIPPITNNTNITNIDFLDRNNSNNNRQYVRLIPRIADADTDNGTLLIQARTGTPIANLATFISINGGSNGLTVFNRPVSLGGNEITNISFNEYSEITTPATPTPDNGRFYAKDVSGVAAPFWLDQTGTEFAIDLGGPFLPLVGGTMMGPITFQNESTGGNPILQSNSTTQDLLLTGNLALGTSFGLKFQSGASIFSTIGFGMAIEVGGTMLDIKFLGFNDIDNIIYTNSDIQTGDIFRTEWVGGVITDVPKSYAGHVVNVIDNTTALLTGSQRFFASSAGNQNVNILGLNINSQDEVFIYDNIRFQNKGLFTEDPTLFADNDFEKVLSVGGDFQINQVDQSASLFFESVFAAPAINQTIGDLIFSSNDDASSDTFAFAVIRTRFVSVMANETASEIRFQARRFDGATSMLSDFFVINQTNSELTNFIRGISLNGNTMEQIGFFDFDRITIPADPPTDIGRLYHKQIDTENDGLFIKLKKNNTIVEVLVA